MSGVPEFNGLEIIFVFSANELKDGLPTNASDEFCLKHIEQSKMYCEDIEETLRIIEVWDTWPRDVCSSKAQLTMRPRRAGIATAASPRGRDRARHNVTCDCDRDVISFLPRNPVSERMPSLF